MIKHFSTPQAAQSWCNDQRQQNRSIGFVPTMGALHPGHINLIQRAREQNDQVVVSIFVNPLQFNNPDDLQKYPRDEASDIQKLADAGIDSVFTGSPEAFLGDAQHLNATQLPDPGIYAQGLEGAHRPGHFAGVREVVARLFNFVGPCRAYFGEKDYQQLQIIRQLANEIQGIAVIGCPTSRETSGLARSSRNLRLSKQGLQDASIIYQAMQAANKKWKSGIHSPPELQEAMLAVLSSGNIGLEYAELRDPLNWTSTQPRRDIEQARVLVAGNVEDVRLIDNMALGD